jgi:ATP-binding cassette subfamily F protein 3
MVLSVSHINKIFDGVPVLTDITFNIDEHDKAAIVGINGAGKTTLLRIIMNELEPDSGIVTTAKDCSVGYLAQKQNVSSENSILNEMLTSRSEVLELETKIHDTEAAMKDASGDDLRQLMDMYASLNHSYEQLDGYAYRSEVTGILKGLGFAEDEFDKKIMTLSGGQKTRVALGKILLCRPELIILDEPTNHLDMSSIRWLETYLLNYKGAVIIVSHDRYFLDRISNKVIELDASRSSVFSGNYTDYANKKEALRAAQMNAYLKQQAEIAHQEAVITKLKSFNREKSIKRAESREKMLDKIELLEKPAEMSDQMKIHLSPRRQSGNDVLAVENLSMAFGPEKLFGGQSFKIRRGEHVAIIGDNGTGKTTILKIINGLTEPLGGTVTLGTNVQIGYYDQEHHVLHDEKNIFEEISDAYPMLNNTQIRTTLAAFLFTGDDVYKPISALSGGEKGRVSLAKLMLSEANFLILDEPTNHLDIQSKEILEDAIRGYDGTVLYVSHDRFFINRTASRILELENHVLTEYLGNYDYYTEKKSECTANDTGESAADTSAEKEASSSALDWKSQKEEQARIRKHENELKKCEDDISKLEGRNAEIESRMCAPEIATDSAELGKLAKEQAENNRQLDLLYAKWEELAN